MQDFKRLEVWQLAHRLQVTAYDLVKGFPREELYGLRSQVTRAAGFVPANIAEGCGRDGDAELARFCTIAKRSASELEYELLLARDLKLLQPANYETLSQQTVEIKRMLTVLVQKLTAES